MSFRLKMKHIPLALAALAAPGVARRTMVSRS